VGAIEELNLLTHICEMFLTSIYHVIALSMHGSLFVLCNIFIFCRFEARTSHHNHTICKFYLCMCLSPATIIIAWVMISFTFIDL
jgi:hypothetical protein